MDDSSNGFISLSLCEKVVISETKLDRLRTFPSSLLRIRICHKLSDGRYSPMVFREAHWSLFAINPKGGTSKTTGP
jgi:hypothetical protein